MKTQKHLYTDAEVMAKAVALLHTRYQTDNERVMMDNPDLAGDYFKLMIGGKDIEHFSVMLLNSGMKMIDCKVLFTGTIDAANVYPREIAKYAILNNAKSVIISHNHPSGDCHPSNADILITGLINKGLKLFNISLNDHIIVCGDHYRSLRSNNDIML